MMIAVFGSAWDNVPRWNADVDWSQAVAMLTTHIPLAGEDKRACPAWSPVRYRDGAKRGKAGVVDVHALVIDYDDGTGPHEALDRWDGFRRLVHTSWSHKPEAPRCRVVMPLASPVDAGVWSGVYESIGQIDGGRPDEKCKDASRLFFVPAVGAGGPHYAIAREGELLDLSDLVHVEREREQARRKEAEARVEASRAARRGVVSSADEARREAMRRLREDPDARREAGAMAGAKIVFQAGHEKARWATCPACGRPSAWWYVNPERAFNARCDHVNSCGWAGPIWEVLG